MKYNKMEKTIFIKSEKREFTKNENGMKKIFKWKSVPLYYGLIHISYYHMYVHLNG